MMITVDAVIRVFPSRVSFQETSLPYSSIPHHYDLNTTITISSSKVFSSYLDRFHSKQEYLSPVILQTLIVSNFLKSQSRIKSLVVLSTV